MNLQGNMADMCFHGKCAIIASLVNHVNAPLHAATGQSSIAAVMYWPVCELRARDVTSSTLFLFKH